MLSRCRSQCSVMDTPGTCSMTRPVGRPPKRPQRFYHSFDDQTKSCDHPRRVVAKVEWHQGELYPRVGFIVTNLGGGSKSAVDFYNGRGTTVRAHLPAKTRER